MTARCPNRQRRHTPSSWTTPNPDTTLLGLYFQQPARGGCAYSGPSQWRHIDANGALFAQSGVGKVTVPNDTSLLVSLHHSLNQARSSPTVACGALPWTTTVSPSLPRSKSPTRKEERLTIDAN